jgi:hypothetical protein
MSDLSPLRQRLRLLTEQIQSLLDKFTDRSALWPGLVYPLLSLA